MMNKGSATDRPKFLLGVDNKNLFSDQTTIHSDLEDDVKEKFAKWIDEFFRTYCELINNETFTPEVLNSLVQSDRSLNRDSFLDRGDRYSDVPLRKIFLTMASTLCPIAIEKLTVSLKKIIDDDNLLERVLEDAIDIDPSTKLVTLKDHVREELKKEPIDKNLFWFDKDLHEKFVEGLNLKYKTASFDPLFFSETYTKIPGFLKNKLSTSTFWKRLTDIVNLLAKIGYWQVYLETFLRCWSLHMTAVLSEVDESQAAAIWSSIDSSLAILEKQDFSTLPIYDHFINHVNSLRKHDSKSGSGLNKNSMIEKSNETEKKSYLEIAEEKRGK